jgi:hypothetical protein
VKNFFSKMHRSSLDNLFRNTLAALLLVSLCSTLATASDNEFRGVVNAIESHYGVHRTHIPLLGFALFFVHTEGVSGIKLAVFEDFHPSVPVGDEVRDVVERSLGPDWHLFVRVQSHADGENTLIYANFSSDKMQMLVVNLDRDEATIVQMKLSDRAIKKWIDEPREKAENESGHHSHRDD